MHDGSLQRKRQETRSSLRFLLDGERIEIESPPPTLTLLQFLREQRGRTGTKEGCAEGDCGACTVVLGELDGETIRYQSVNSCIRFLWAVDGCEVVTVESLADPAGPLHPVQQAMVDQHASQCGFCTPGFVMSLFALYLNQALPLQRARIVSGLSGNLCRCTGYRPIIDAGLTLQDYPEPNRWSRTDAFSEWRREALLALQDPRPIAVDHPQGCLRVPRTLEQVSTHLAADPQAMLVAGATDVGLWVTKDLRRFSTMIQLTRIPELRVIEDRTDTRSLWIGAAVSLEDAFTALGRHFPALHELHDRFASPPIRHAGTLGGNVANGSPIGDSMPFLLALGATVILYCPSGSRALPLEDFYLDYRVTALRPDEIVAALEVPFPESGMQFATYKISKRHDQDISAVCAAFCLHQDAQGTITSIRMGYGGMAAIPRRALLTEQALLGKPWDRMTVDSVLPILQKEFSPLDDLRASADYRRKVAARLLLRFFLESTQEAAGHV